MLWKNKKFAEAYNKYYPVIYSTAYTKIGNTSDTEDLCQELFIKFYNKLETIENMRKWLYGALKYELLNYYKKKNIQTVDIDEIFDDVALTYVNGFNDSRIVINEAIENIENFKNDSEYILFKLIAIQHFTYEEAGKQLGLTKRQVRYKYTEISNRLCHYLKKKGIKNLEDLL